MALFAAVTVCFIVFQIKNPPSPAVQHNYTSNKVNTLLFDYADDGTQTDGSVPETDTQTEQNGEDTSQENKKPTVYGLMIERTVGDNVFEYYYLDFRGKIEYALSTELTKTEYETETEYSYITVNTDDFFIPEKLDYDTPEGDEVKIYLNTSKGTRLKAVTQAEFEASEYKNELDKMIQIFEGVNKNEN